jgi:acetyl esterase/lipase
VLRIDGPTAGFARAAAPDPERLRADWTRRRRRRIIARMIGLIVAALLAQQGDEEPTFPATEPAPALRLWAGDAPGARADSVDDVPTLTPYLPAVRTTRTAVVVFPGGGYGHLAPHEGEGYARWLCGYGIAAFVVKYRLGRHGYRHPAMLRDAARAVRTVRARATEWGVDPARVGVIGSSAGGHLASTILTHCDRGDPTSDDPVERESSRPDFGILCYAVIGLGDELAHEGSRRNLLGDDPDPALVELLSNERQVRADTPPTFLWHTADDPVVSVRNSYAFADALARSGVPHELHVYPHGRHGLGVGFADPTGKRVAELLPWTRACVRWLAEVLDGREVADGAPAELLRIAERWTEELVRDLPRNPEPWGVYRIGPSMDGSVVARVGHAVIVQVEDDPAGLIDSAVGRGAAFYAGSLYFGSGRIVDRDGAFVIVTLAHRSPAGAPGPGSRFASIEW